MNTNFFNQRKSLRAFQNGGSMPQREQFNSEEEYNSAVESYMNSMGTPSVASSFVGPQDNSTQNVTPPIVASSSALQTPPQTQAIPGYQGASVVDFLKSMGIDSSKANRKKLAALSGDDNYNMSGEDNQALMDYVKKNAQGNDKIRNIDGNIVSLDGSSQVPMTIAGLDKLNRTGSVSGKKSKTDDFLRQGTPEYNARAMELFGSKPIPNVSNNTYVAAQNNNTQTPINFLNRTLNFGDSSSPYDTIPNYDRDNKNNLGFLQSLKTGTTDQIDFKALKDIVKAIKNNSGRVITSDGRNVEYSSLSNIDKEKLQSEIANYKRDSYTF